MKVFNTLSRSIEEFVPIDPAAKKVGLYCCGPTVHNFAHIGNFRTFVFADLLRRFLEFKGYSVNHVMNITDVEDKIIKSVHASGRSLADYTREYETAFLADFDALGCLRPHQLPRATEHIAEIVDIIQRLLDRGVAYQAADGSVYFSIQKYIDSGARYGVLLKLNFEAMRTGERVSSDEYQKEAIADFALWKARVPEDGAVHWPAPWGEGRPGWHIECSAMSAKLLGSSFDLHLGGEDLIFPHHEDEIAQSEGAGLCAHGERFVKYWMHGAHLLVEGKKMAKSLGNFFTLRDLLQQGFTGREIRFLLLSAHYREGFNFTLENLAGARTALARIDECITKLTDLAAGTSAPSGPVAEIVAKVDAALSEDLNVAGAWGHIFEWVRDCNKAIAENRLTATEAATALAAWQRINSVLGISAQSKDEAPAELLALLEERQAARKARNFARADAIRDELKAKGWIIEDTAKGPKLKKL